MLVVRRGRPEDLEEVAAIQNASPEASQWDVADYLERDFVVAEEAGRIGGFMVTRAVAADELELLNLAVAPAWRRRGVARRLVSDLVGGRPGTVWLEVRESNHAARNFYKSIGFQEVGLRTEYYQNPPETAVVMKLRSC